MDEHDLTESILQFLEHIQVEDKIFLVNYKHIMSETLTEGQKEKLVHKFIKSQRK